MRGFLDLSVDPGDAESLADIAKHAARLGIEGLGVDYALAASAAPVEGLRLLPRYTVRASTKREARLQLERAPRRALVVLEALSLDTLRYGGVSKLVDVVRPGPGLEHYAVDQSQARLFRERGWGAVEVSVRGLSVSSRPGIWRRFIVTVRRAFASGVPLVLVSDARAPMELWHPRSLVGLLVLAGVPEERALASVYNEPARVAVRKGLA